MPVPPVDAVGSPRVLAIDFETANTSRASPCSIGIAWIGDGQVTHRAYRLIRPMGNRFHPMNIVVHGIGPEDVEDAAAFPDVWRELAPHFENATVLAHNGGFDFGVLRETLALYGLPPPRMSCFCTLVASRQLWPGLDNHKLSTVARHVGFSFGHHHAGEDALACAEIVLEQMRVTGTGDIAAAARAIGICVGSLDGDGYSPSRKLQVGRVPRRHRQGQRLPERV